MSYIKNLLPALAAVFFLAGCGGGGGGASTATITAANAKDLAVAGTEATKASSTSSDFMPYKSGSSSLDAKDITKMVIQNLHATQDLSLDICTGGSGTAIFEYPDDPYATSGTVSFTFTDCVYSDIYETVTINGSIIITVGPSSASFSANLYFTENSITESFSFNGSCSVSSGTVGNCTYRSSFTGVDGRTYSMANISVSGDDFSGYTVSGSVTDPDHGVVTISTPQPVTFNCAGGNPDYGQIIVTGSNGSATVTYNDCSSFTVTFDGVPTTYYWADF